MLFALLTLSPMVQGQDTSQQERLRDVLAGISPEEVASNRQGGSLYGTNPHVNEDFPNEEITEDGLVFYVEGAAEAPIVSEACEAAIAKVGDHASDEDLQTLIASCGAGDDVAEDDDRVDDDERRRSTDTSLIACYTNNGHYVANCKDSCNRSDGYFRTGTAWWSHGCCRSFWDCFGNRAECQRINVYRQGGDPIQVIRNDCRKWLIDEGRHYKSAQVGGANLSKACINNRIHYLLMSTSGKAYFGQLKGHCKAKF